MDSAADSWRYKGDSWRDKQNAIPKKNKKAFIKSAFAMDKEICPECWSKLEVFKDKADITLRCPKCAFTVMADWHTYKTIKEELETLYQEIERENK